jgi:excisionase family DNA binding protein
MRYGILPPFDWSTHVIFDLSMKLNDDNKTAPIGALNVKQAAQYIGVSERTLWRLRDSGEIPHSQINRRIVFRIKALDQFLKEREVIHV